MSVCIYGDNAHYQGDRPEPQHLSRDFPEPSVIYQGIPESVHDQSDRIQEQKLSQPYVLYCVDVVDDTGQSEDDRDHRAYKVQEIHADRTEHAHAQAPQVKKYEHHQIVERYLQIVYVRPESEYQDLRSPGGQCTEHV